MGLEADKVMRHIHKINVYESNTVKEFMARADLLMQESCITFEIEADEYLKGYGIDGLKYSYDIHKDKVHFISLCGALSMLDYDFENINLNIYRFDREPFINDIQKILGTGSVLLFEKLKTDKFADKDLKVRMNSKTTNLVVANLNLKSMKGTKFNKFSYELYLDEYDISRDTPFVAYLLNKIGELDAKELEFRFITDESWVRPYMQLETFKMVYDKANERLIDKIHCVVGISKDSDGASRLYRAGIPGNKYKNLSIELV